MSSLLHRFKLKGRHGRNRWAWGLLWILFFLASLLRIAQECQPEWCRYVHDLPYHEYYVAYVAEHRVLPPPGYAFEFPQQPLYYVIAACFYDPALSGSANEPVLGRLGLVFSLGTLGLIFASLRYFSSWLLRFGLLIYMGFVPYFILNAPCVGNDGLIAFFGAWFFFCLARLNRQPRGSGNLLVAGLVLLGALLTKLNALSLLVAVPWMLWRVSRGEMSWKPTLIRTGIFLSVLSVWSSLVLLRAWSPPSHRLILVQSKVWANMEIRTMPYHYIFSWDFPDLFRAGETTTDFSTFSPVHDSFFPYFYGKMLLNEYDYRRTPLLLFSARQILIEGTFWIFGFLLFFSACLLSRRRFWPLNRLITWNRLTLLLIMSALALLLAYLKQYPNTCNADFRFFAAIYPWVGYAMNRGLCLFPRQQVMAAFTFLGLGWFTYSSVMLWLVLIRHT